MSSSSTPGPVPPDISRGSDLIITCWLTLSIALLLVSLRLYIRGFLRKNLGWDDHLILLASVLAIAQGVLATLQVKSGFGRNIQYLTPVQLQKFGLYTDVYILVQIVGTVLVRISVCLFVLRLVPATKTSYRRWIWGLVACNVIISLTAFLAFCFQCIPLSGLWDKDVKAQCFPRADMNKIARFQSSTAAITDFFCVLLPMLIFRKLQANLRDKVAIFFILGIGCFTATTAIARTAVLNLASQNPTWDSVPVAIWACLEQNIGIAVASMPALRQLLTIRKKERSSRSSERLSSHNSNTRPSLRALARISYNDCFRLPDDDALGKTTSSRDSSTPTPKTSDIESCRGKKASPGRPGTTTRPLWADRKTSLAETVEMSRVSPTPTFVERKPSAAETLRLSMVTPSWEAKAPSTDNHNNITSKTHTATGNSRNNRKRLSMVSPLSLTHDDNDDNYPAPLFSVRKMQQLGRFDETGLRNSRVATPEEIVTLANPAAMGYSCRIEGGRTPTTTKTSPYFPT